MDQNLGKRRNQFEFSLQRLDDMVDFSNDSPAYLSFNSRDNQQENSNLKGIISQNSQIISSKPIIFDDFLYKNTESSNTEDILRGLKLEDDYIITKLTTTERSIYESFSKRAKKHFNFSLNTIFLAFTLFLQYSKGQKLQETSVVIACFLIASKFCEPKEKIPFSDELIELFSKESEIDEKQIQGLEL